MTFWVAGAVVGSSLIGANAASSAASAQAGAANRAADLSNEQYQQTRADQAPFREAGLTAQNKLMSLLGIGGDAAGAGYGKYGRDFSMADYQADPGYQFRLSEGQRALAHSAGSRSGLVSGTSLKAMQDYAQNSASGEYTNAFNRYQTNRSNQLNPLQSLMGAGQSSTNFLGAAGANNATNMGNLMTSGAAAQAAGQVGTANAITGGLGTYLNYNQGNNLVNALRSGGGGRYGMSSPTSMTQQEYAIASGGY
jgi:hypothetical protein